MIDFPLVFLGFWRAPPSKMMVLPTVFQRKALSFHLFLLVFWRASPSEMLVWPTVFDGKSLFFSLVFVVFFQRGTRWAVDIAIKSRMTRWAGGEAP